MAVAMPKPSNQDVVVLRADTVPKPVTKIKTRIKPQAIAEKVNKVNLIINFSSTALEAIGRLIIK